MGRRWGKYGLPVSLVLGFAGLLAAAVGHNWWPALPVKVMPVMLIQSNTARAETPLFQAAGWIEPRPAAVSVTALTSGVIAELFVVEGQTVAAQQPIAKLVDVDAELALRQVRANRAIKIAQLQRAEAELSASVMRLKNPVHLTGPLADANSELAKIETEKQQLPFLIESAKAKLKFAESNLQGKRLADQAVSQRLLEQAESDFSAAESTLNDLLQRGPNLERQAVELQKKVESAQSQLTLLVEEKRQEQEAQAQVAIARAMVDEANLQVEQAELNLTRTLVQAPFAGRILRVHALPGSRVTAGDSGSGANFNAIVEMYNPEQLQVRADVRLEDVPRVQPGQKVEVRTAAFGEVIVGEVLQATSNANIQKNTLEVKVALIQPPPSIRPEMLVTATFLAPQSEVSDNLSTPIQRIMIPQRLIESSESGSAVWIVTSEGRAERRSIVLGSAVDADLMEVIEGLDPTDKLISSGSESLRSGERVTVIGEDQTLGVD